MRIHAKKQQQQCRWLPVRVALTVVTALTLITTSQTAATAETVDASGEAAVVDAIDNIEPDIDSDATVVDKTAVNAVELPDDNGDAVTIDVDGDSLEVAPPIETNGDTTVIGDTTVVGSVDESVGYGVQAIEDSDTDADGVRQLIVINDSSAADEYRFDVDLPDGASLVTAADLFGAVFDTGEIFVVDAAGEVVSIVDPPWAKDGNGDNVATTYRVDGDSIIQSVDFDDDTVFPVVADPSWWKIAKCTGAILFVLGSTLFSVAKILKFKKLVKSLGGVREAAKLFAGAGTVTEAVAGLGGATKQLALELLGVTAIKEACF